LIIANGNNIILYFLLLFSSFVTPLVIHLPTGYIAPIWIMPC
jgi:hypothetical protein